MPVTAGIWLSAGAACSPHDVVSSSFTCSLPSLSAALESISMYKPCVNFDLHVIRRWGISN